MALTQSYRQPREWPLLIFALAVILGTCIPLKQWLAERPFADTAWDSRVDRLNRMLLGPEQMACYICFSWGALILLSRYREVVRQRKAFGLNLLPTEEGARILPEDARPIQRKSEQTILQRGPLILANLIRLALGKYAVTRSSRDVSDTLRAQADYDLSRMVTSMSIVHYLAWAIPALGFLGTVRGLAMSFTMAGGEKLDLAVGDFLNQATTHLNVAFDCTLVALALSLPIMFMIHWVQRDEEGLVIDCQQYCLEHLVNRLYDPEPLPEEVNGTSRPRPAVMRAVP
jgi:biopolymer transport protein ExbB/TolQ